jgi:hypothetical protein
MTHINFSQNVLIYTLACETWSSTDKYTTPVLRVHISSLTSERAWSPYMWFCNYDNPYGVCIDLYLKRLSIYNEVLTKVIFKV